METTQSDWRREAPRLPGHRKMTTAPALAEPAFSLAESRGLVRDLFEPKAWIYWTDFLVSILTGHIFYGLVRGAFAITALPTWAQYTIAGAAFLISSLAYYRAVMFTHELVHLRTGTFTSFRIVWNLLCGIPFLVPSFTYYTHLDHHRRKHYGTAHDGEYLPWGNRGIGHLIFYMSQVFLVPLLGVFRFLILTPLTWLHPSIRNWVHQHASSMIVDPQYVRPLPTNQDLRLIRLQEALCFAWCLGVAVVPPLFLGRWPWLFLLQGYATAIVILSINSIRTLGAHRWANQGEEMTFVEQMLDSVNVTKWTLASEIWGPIGLKYHALHHVFPSMPYHEMGKAHDRLMEKLPADSVYRKTTEASLASALLDLCKRSLAAKKRNAGKSMSTARLNEAESQAA
jgi:fatty acid desaturase